MNNADFRHPSLLTIIPIPLSHLSEWQYHTSSQLLKMPFVLPQIQFLSKAPLIIFPRYISKQSTSAHTATVPLGQTNIISIPSHYGRPPNQLFCLFPAPPLLSPPTHSSPISRLPWQIRTQIRCTMTFLGVKL